MSNECVLSSFDWFELVIARCQTFIVAQSPTEFDIVDVASTFIRELPDPRCRGEDVLLRGLLLDVADHWGASLHEELHQRSDPARCVFSTTSMLRHFLDRSREAAKPGFLDWARTFRAELHRVHPISPARQAAAFIRERAGERSDAAALAARLGVSSRQLRRAFHLTYGMTLTEYLQQARLLRALETMTSEPGKIEPVALDVGYRSKKDFYRVFRDVTAMTPRAFIRLPTDSKRRLIDRVRSALTKREMQTERPAIRPAL